VTEITTRILGITIESFFKRPILYKDARCDETAQKCVEAFSSYGLRPPQTALRIGDLAFNYDLSFGLFNGNGSFKISSEKLEIHFQNVVSDRDFEVVSDCIAKLYEHVPLPEINSTAIIGNAQTTAPSIEAIQKYLQRNANPSKEIVQAGTIAYISGKNWPAEIRLMVDRSLIFPEGLYLMWSTTFSGNKLSRDILKTLKEACEEAAGKLDLTFPKTEPQ